MHMSTDTATDERRSSDDQMTSQLSQRLGHSGELVAR
jgi:hypothetical protein